MSGGGGRGRAVLVLAVLVAGAARAQAPDTTRARPDSLATLFAPEALEPGRPIGRVPALTPALDPEDLLRDAPATFAYDLGIVGAPDGLALGGLDPRRPALTLDGLPLTDLFTERPRYDLLPFDLLDRLRLGESRFGRPGAVAATTRTLRTGRPLTELRYLAGGSGVQYVGATHAQARRAPRFLAREGRLTFLAHAAGRQADGPYTGGALSGWHALARVGLLRTDLAADLTFHMASRRLGAREGVSPAGDFDTVYDPLVARVEGASARRETVRSTLALTLHARLLGAAPLAASLYGTRQHERYTPGGPDTLEAKGNRLGLRLAQPFRAGAHRLALRLDAWRDGAPWGRSNPLPGLSPATQAHATLADSLSFGGWRLAAEAGAHATGGDVFPSASGKVEGHVGAAEVFASAVLAGAAPGRVERAGFGDLVGAGGGGSTERTLRAEAGVTLPLGSLRLRASGSADEVRNARLFVQQADTASSAAFAFVTAPAPLRHALATVGVDFRADAPQGLYVTTDVTFRTALDADASVFQRREADALPRVWGRTRLGFRALGLFQGALDLDLAADARGWSAFRGRLFHAPTGLFALADPSDAVPVPARGTVDLVAEARLQRRASFFLALDHALAGLAYPGVFVVPGSVGGNVHPLPGRRLRFGVFWVLFD